MIPKIFKPEDFALMDIAIARILDYPKIREGELSAIQDQCVKFSQRAFEQWIKENGEQVFGNCNGGYMWGTMKHETSTHQAILICVEPIEKECVEHEPDLESFNDYSILKPRLAYQNKSKCKHCGKKLKAKWEIDE